MRATKPTTPNTKMKSQSSPPLIRPPVAIHPAGSTNAQNAATSAHTGREMPHVREVGVRGA